MIRFLDQMDSPRPLIGMVHLLPLPGSPRYDGDLGFVQHQALRDAAILAEEGFHGLIVENFGDAPFLPGKVAAETVAAMALLTARVIAEVNIPVGVNVLRNDARSALGIAAAAGARFIRVNVHIGATVTDQGLIEGKAHETMRERARIAPDVAVLADVLVKHGTPLGAADAAQAARETAGRGLADGLLVTGAATGSPTDAERVRIVSEAAGATPVLVASGLTAGNAEVVLRHADGAIVGSSVKRGGDPEAPVDRARARALVEAVRKAFG